ncbi:MAG TPA: outer membrane protein assembly factor BamE [Rhodocyclaceae bacterium]|nr:outer membrane protein assembly factor BamE [Rhodocyclaceae bacterium]
MSQTMVAQLSPGMTQEQVRYIMGSPLLVDPFHKDRWDYIYRLSHGNGSVEERRITVLFQDGKLSHLEGDVIAASGKAGSSEPVVPHALDIGSPSGSASGAPGDKK